MTAEAGRVQSVTSVLSCRNHVLDALREQMRWRSADPDWVDNERRAVAMAANEWASAYKGMRVTTVEDVELTSCCGGAAEYGPTDCSCWEPIYDLDQHPADLTIEPDTRSAPCDDCAYRPDSPESQGDDRYRDKPTDPGAVFWCHQGMRKPTHFRHRLGIVVEANGDFYEPPIREHDGVAVPYQADGTPGDRCAGWSARRRADGLVLADVAWEAAQ